MKRIKEVYSAFFCFCALTVICGVLYTGIITGISQMLFTSQANGSIVEVLQADGSKKSYGSLLIGQNFTESRYLIGRPMEVSNLSPMSEEHRRKVEERVDTWNQTFSGSLGNPIPLELVSASASGVDPHISPQAAEFQVERIAKVRNISPETVREIILQETKGRFLSFFGRPTVNVLKVNLALDGLERSK